MPSGLLINTVNNRPCYVLGHIMGCPLICHWVLVVANGLSCLPFSLTVTQEAGEFSRFPAFRCHCLQCAIKGAVLVS